MVVFQLSPVVICVHFVIFAHISLFSLFPFLSFSLALSRSVASVLFCFDLFCIYIHFHIMQSVKFNQNPNTSPHRRMNPLPFRFDSLIYVYMIHIVRNYVNVKIKASNFVHRVFFCFVFTLVTHSHILSLSTHIQNVSIEPNTDGENGIDAFLESVWYDAETHQFKCEHQKQTKNPFRPHSSLHFFVSKQFLGVLLRYFVRFIWLLFPLQSQNRVNKCVDNVSPMPHTHTEYNNTENPCALFSIQNDA